MTTRGRCACFRPILGASPNLLGICLTHQPGKEDVRTEEFIFLRISSCGDALIRSHGEKLGLLGDPLCMAHPWEAFLGIHVGPNLVTRIPWLQIRDAQHAAPVVVDFGV